MPLPTVTDPTNTTPFTFDIPAELSPSVVEAYQNNYTGFWPAAPEGTPLGDADRLRPGYRPETNDYPVTPNEHARRRVWQRIWSDVQDHFRREAQSELQALTEIANGSVDVDNAGA